MTRKAKSTRRLMSVKHSDDVDTKVTLKPQYISVGTVKYLDNDAIQTELACKFPQSSTMKQLKLINRLRATR